jgi:hypothetical protein
LLIVEDENVFVAVELLVGESAFAGGESRLEEEVGV